MICINCGADDQGRFCSNCGQSLEVKRITIKEQWHDFVNKMYGFDGQFLRTVKDVTIRPGHVAREFIKGNRVLYFGPIGYYFFMITVFFLVLGIIDMSFMDYMKQMQDQVPMEYANAKAANAVQSFVSDNMKIFAFLIPPFMALVSQRIFFRKQGLNFLEHSVPVFYVLGHWYWISIIEVIQFYFTGKVLGSTAQLWLISLYLGFGYVTFVPTQPKWKVFLKGVGVYFTGITLAFIVLTVIGAAVIMVSASLFPETFEFIQPSKQIVPK